MNRRHRKLPREWLIADERNGDGLLPAVRNLPSGSGILLTSHSLSRGEQGRLARTARGRKLLFVEEGRGEAARVHNARELLQAQLAGTRLLFLSPMFPTRSHPHWRPLPRMRAATLIRLARVPVIALGGMNSKRFARVKRLGFYGWAGISGWLPRPSRE